MKRRKIIFFILIQFLAGVMLASNPEDIATELKFEPVQINFEEGFRHVVSIYEVVEDRQGVF